MLRAANIMGVPLIGVASPPPPPPPPPIANASNDDFVTLGGFRLHFRP